MHLSSLRNWIVAGALSAAAGAAWSQELTREAFPGRWVEEMAPEKLPDLKHPAHYNDLDKARAEVFRGRYRRALITLEKAQGKPADIAVVKAQALAATGRRAEAIDALSAADVADQPPVQVQKARILSEMGRWDEAISLLRTHLEKNKESVAGHYYLGSISEKVGDTETARQAYDWIYKTYYERWQGQGARDFEDAEEVTLMGKAFDRWAQLNQAARHDPQDLRAGV
jgi:predicted Zn-dependent protease